MRRLETNYRFITKDDSVTRPVQVGISGSTNWPPAKKLGFNQSQYDAFKLALTKEFAIIQGTNALTSYIWHLTLDTWHMTSNM